MHNIVPIVICGGWGTRLWPLSTPKSPKQFVNFDGGSLFNRTISRLIHRCKDIIVITNIDNREHISNEVSHFPNNNFHTIYEEEKLDTLVALSSVIKYITLHLQEDDHRYLMLPCDHLIDNFDELLTNAMMIDNNSDLVIYGRKPDSPHTGYGYIQTTDNCEFLKDVHKFHEKPDINTAVKYMENGHFYWNLGILYFSMPVIMGSINICGVNILDDIHISSNDGIYIAKYVGNDSYKSIDFELLERIQNIKMIEYQGGWIDIGSWSSLVKTDIINTSNISQVKCNNIVSINNTNKNISIIGLTDIIVYVDNENILITSYEDCELVKKLSTA